MKQRRKVELLIADIRKALANRTRDASCDELVGIRWTLPVFAEQLAGSVDKVRLLLEIARLAREATGPGRDVAEEGILKCMAQVVRKAGNRLEDADVKSLPAHAIAESLAPDLRTAAEVIKTLCEYAMDCHRYNPRPRDTFAGLRRGLAFDILAHGTWFFEIPEALDLARQALRRKRPQEVRGAIVYIEDFFKAREDLPMPKDIIESLLAVAAQTDSHSTATGALNALVEAHEISEFEASDRMDDWEAKHYQ